MDLRIGVVDGPTTYVFGRVSGIAEDGAGRIFVSDFTANEVRAFSPEGSYLFTIGREGAGPGEWRGPCCLAFSPDGILWVRDGGNRRYVGYRVAADGAEHAATLRMAHSDGWHYAPLGFTADGEFIDTGYSFQPGDQPELRRFHLGASGEVLRFVPVPEPSPQELGTRVRSDNANVFFFPQPFGAEFLLAHGPNGIWATAISSRFNVTGHAPDGTTFSVVEVTPEGPVLSESDRAWAIDRTEAYVQRGGGVRSDYPEVPARKPALAALMFDREGRLWVSINTAEADDARAQLYDQQGVLIGQRTWPRDVNIEFPAWLGSDHAVGIVTDSLGVQRVARVVW